MPLPRNNCSVMHTIEMWKSNLNWVWCSVIQCCFIFQIENENGTFSNIKLDYKF